MSKKTTTTTTTTTMTRELMDHLTPMEEKVIRMRHGIKARASEELRFVDEDPILQDRIAAVLIEQRKRFDATPAPVAQREAPVASGPRKSEILARLKRKKKD